MSNRKRKAEAMVEYFNNEINSFLHKKRDLKWRIKKLAIEQRSVKDRLSELFKLRNMYKEAADE